MGYLAVVAFASALFFGFLLLTRHEARRGARYFAPARASFDARIDQTVFIATHVDFETLVRDGAKSIGAHLAHDVAHLSLLTVRSAERLLTRLVKHLRSNHGIEPTATAAPRAFVKTMRDFKTHLVTTRPPIPEV